MCAALFGHTIQIAGGVEDQVAQRPGRSVLSAREIVDGRLMPRAARSGGEHEYGSSVMTASVGSRAEQVAGSVEHDAASGAAAIIATRKVMDGLQEPLIAVQGQTVDYAAAVGGADSGVASGNGRAIETAVRADGNSTLRIKPVSASTETQCRRLHPGVAEVR